MIVHTFEQYSNLWWQFGKGLPSASKANKIITAKTGALSAQARPYMCKLIAEKLGLADPKPDEDSFSNYWMDRGLEMEGEARRFFTFETGLDVVEVGSVTNDDGTARCSPDSLVVDGLDRVVPETIIDGDVIGAHTIAGLEIKCCMPATHIDYFLCDGLPDVYKQQIHFSLAVTGLPVWYWLSYHPDLDPVLIEVKPDKYTEKVATAIEQFIIAQCDALQKIGE